MQRVTVLILCITGFVFANWMKVLGTSESPLPPKKWVMATDSLFVFIRNEIVGFIQEDTVVDLQNFQRIKIPEEAVDYDTSNIGKPQIPYIRLLIAVPDSVEFDITVYESDPSLFEDYLLYPVPEVIFESDAGGHIYPVELFTYDASFYSQDTFYPGTFYEIKKDGHWRDQRVLEVFLYPVQFNPQKHEMYFYHNLDIRIEYLGDIVENFHGLGPFEELGEELLLNYSGDTTGTRGGSAPTVHYYTDLLNPGNSADYLIVTHEDFLYNPTAQQWIDDFAWWRANHNRFDVGVVKMQDIYVQFPDSSPDSAAVLREFLKYAYDNWQAPHMTDGHFAYGLFIGDWDYVPAKLRDDVHISVWADEGYFRSLTSPPLETSPFGWDDIMLGRWPVKAATGSDIENMVTIAEKTINYEKYPVTDESFRRSGLLIAGHNDEHYNFDSYVDASTPYFSDICYDTFTVRLSELGDTVWFDSISYYLNQGEILAIYYDHGSTTEWYYYDTTRVKQLENGNRLPVVLTYACYTASFQWDHPVSGGSGCTCFGEHFIFNPNGGCVAYYGATTGAGADVEGIIERLLRYQHWILGTSIFGFSSRPYCLLGDPALDLGDYTAYPDLPDLVVRPQGIDISLLPPYPYVLDGDSIPIHAEVWNIGRDTAYNVAVEFRIQGGDSIGWPITLPVITIPEISPRGSVEVATYWEPPFPDYYGEIDECGFRVEVDPLNTITESWEANNYATSYNKVVHYPYQSGWPKKILGCSQPAIGRLRGTGTVEIVCSGLDSVYVFDGNGNKLYNWPQYFFEVHSVVLGDINNDRKEEIVAVSRDSVKVYNWQGDTLWAREIPDKDGYDVLRPPSLGRIENSSSRYLDIVLMEKNVGNGPFKVIIYDCNGDLRYEYESNTSASLKGYGPASISDINDDGKAEIVVSAEAWPGFTSIFNKDGWITRLPYGSGRMTPALADVNGDEYPDLITGDRYGKIRAYNAKDDVIVWMTQTGGYIKSSPAVGNINPTPEFPGNEIAFGNDSSEIWAIRGENGQPWFPWWIEVDGSVRTSPALAYIDDNPGLDIVIGAHDQYIYALKHDGLAIPPFPLPVFGLPSSPLIGDIDGDLTNEIIITTDDDYLHVWTNVSRSEPSYKRLEWPQFHHDYQRTGLYGWYERMSVIPKFKVSMQEFSMVTSISCSLSTSLQTQITIYNSQGEPVKTLTNQQLSTGEHEFDWDGTDDNNNLLPNGAYIIELKTEQGIETIPVEINR